MKKLLPLTLFFASLNSYSAFAKTEGSYVGLDLIGTKLKFYQRSNIVNSGPTDAKPANSHVTYGAGLNYKYAVNFNGFFIAPGIILEQNSFGGEATDGHFKERLQAKNRYGIKSDIGFDINETVAPYLTVGYARAQYKVRSNGYDISNNVVTAVSNYGGSNIFFGGGMKFTFSKDISINLEYNYQKLTTKNIVPSGAQDYITKSTYVSRMDIAKIGLSYNF